jgi:hypothetical protein
MDEIMFHFLRMEEELQDARRFVRKASDPDTPQGNVPNIHAAIDERLCALEARLGHVVAECKEKICAGA